MAVQSKTSARLRVQDRSLQVFTRIQCKSPEQYVESKAERRRGAIIRDARKREKENENEAWVRYAREPINNAHNTQNFHNRE